MARTTTFGLDTYKVERRKHTPGQPVVVEMPFPPSVNSLFGQSPGHKRFPTDSYKDWQSRAEGLLAVNKPTRVPGRIHLLFELGENDKRQRDLDNHLKAPIDMLVSQNIIDGDHSAFVRQIEAKWVPGLLGIRITITPIELMEVA